MSFQDQLNEFIRLHDLFHRGATGNLTEFARKFNVSESTIYRRVKDFENFFETTVLFDHERNSYVYAEPFELHVNITIVKNGERKKL